MRIYDPRVTIYALMVLAGAWDVRAATLNGYFAIGNITQYADYGFGPYSFRARSFNDLLAVVGTKSDTNTQWLWRNADNRTLNTNCWTYGLDFSGMTTVPASCWIELITPNYGVATTHFQPTPGQVVVFSDSNGNLQTNGVFSVTTNPTNDLALVKMSNAAPATVHPFPVMPADFRSRIASNNRIGLLPYLGGGVNFPFGLIWFRPDSGHMNFAFGVVDNPHTDFSVSGMTDLHALLNSLYYTINPDPVPSVAFADGTTSSGDSGGPVYVLVNKRPVLVFATHSANMASGSVAGPIISDSLEWVQANIGSDTLNITDLSFFTNY